MTDREFILKIRQHRRAALSAANTRLAKAQADLDAALAERDRVQEDLCRTPNPNSFSQEDLEDL